MRILYLTDPSPDYLADQLYVGLCHVVGQEDVIDYPCKAIYHDPSHRVHYVPQIPGRRYSADDVLDGLRGKQFDVIILSSPRPGAVDALKSFYSLGAIPPVIMFDGEDDALIRRMLYRRFRCALYFKREYRGDRKVNSSKRLEQWLRFKADTDLFKRTYPLPISIALETLPFHRSSVSEVDVSYVARASHPKRIQAVSMLRATSGIRFEGGVYTEAEDRQSKLVSGWRRFAVKLRGDPVVTFAQRGTKLTISEYYALLGRSKMALSIRGGGFDTLRYWEIPAFRTLLISEQPNIEIPNNFVHGIHALFCKPDLSDLVPLVKEYSSEPETCAAIANAGHQHLLKYHTCERRAEYVLDICSRLL